MVDWRPVDCDTGAVLPILPGYTTRHIYKGGIGVHAWNGECWHTRCYAAHANGLDLLTVFTHIVRLLLPCSTYALQADAAAFMTCAQHAWLTSD